MLRLRGHRFSPAYNPLYSVAGLLVGALVGMTGVGGGSLMTPLLVLLFGFHPATAVGTDLLYASVTKTVGTAVHDNARPSTGRSSLSLACGSVPSSIAHDLRDEPGGNARRARRRRAEPVIIGATLLLTGLLRLLPAMDHPLGRAALRPHGRASHFGLDDRARVRARSPRLRDFGRCGRARDDRPADALSHASCRADRRQRHRARGSADARLRASATGCIGSVNFTLMAALLIGSIPGIILGSYFAAKTSDAVLRPVLALTLLVVSVRMLIG